MLKNHADLGTIRIHRISRLLLELTELQQEMFFVKRLADLAGVGDQAVEGVEIPPEIKALGGGEVAVAHLPMEPCAKFVAGGGIAGATL